MKRYVSIKKNSSSLILWNSSCERKKKIDEVNVEGNSGGWDFCRLFREGVKLVERSRNSLSRFLDSSNVFLILVQCNIRDDNEITFLVASVSK